MRKKTSVCLLLAVLLLFGIPTVSAAQANKIYFKASTSADYADGGVYAMGANEKVTPAGQNGLEVSGDFRVLWAFTNAVVEANPYLYIKGGSKVDGIAKITLSRNWDVEPEIEIEFGKEQKVYNLLEILKDQTTIGYTYVVVYVGKGEGQPTTGSFDYIYLSNVDEKGKVYEKPVQPKVPDGDPAKEIRYQLKAYEKDNAPDGYGFMLSPDAKVTPKGNGFTMQRKQGSAATAFNVAWVVPYDQLKTTPYLVFEIGNEGRANEGPRVDIYAYWEGVVGSYARFDLIPAAIGANSLNGVTKLPLKYAVDNVKESLHGDKGIAIILSVAVDERTDATTLEPLVVKDAYLLGYKEGGKTDSSKKPESVVSNPVGESSQAGEVSDPEASEPDSQDETSDESAEVPADTDPDDNAGGKTNRLWIWILLAVVAAAGAVTAAVLLSRKKPAPEGASAESAAESQATESDSQDEDKTE